MRKRIEPVGILRIYVGEDVKRKTTRNFVAVGSITRWWQRRS